MLASSHQPVEEKWIDDLYNCKPDALLKKYLPTASPIADALIAEL